MTVQRRFRTKYHVGKTIHEWYNNLNRLAVSGLVNEQADHVYLGMLNQWLMPKLKKARTLIINQLRLRFTFIVTSVIISILHFHTTGLVVVLKLIFLSFQGLQDHLTKPREIFAYDIILKIMSSYPLPRGLAQLRESIVQVVAGIHHNMFGRV